MLSRLGTPGPGLGHALKVSVRPDTMHSGLAHGLGLNPDTTTSIFIPPPPSSIWTPLKLKSLDFSFYLFLDLSPDLLPACTGECKEERRKG